MVSLQICAMMLGLSAPGQTVLIDFRADYCAPCRAMDPTIEQLHSMGYPVQRVNIDQNPALAQQYKVTSIPCFVLLVDGREVERVVGGRDIGTLQGMMAKAGVTPKQNVIAPSLIRETTARGNKAEQAGGSTMTPPTITMPGQISQTPFKSVPAPAPNGTGGEEPRDKTLAANLIAATVRLRIEDGDGNSIGTGTIIDSRDGHALVLTCGHVFRDSNGKGRITAELFGASGSQRVEGRMLTFDLKSDVGLLTIPVNSQVAVARVAPPESLIAKGDRVISVGCNHGDDPTARESAITNINRFQGSPNLQVAGQPVQGRSGGGLFNANGQLIGVCNAADPTDNEGLYAAMAAVHTALDGAKLSFVYKVSDRNNQVVGGTPSKTATLPTFPKTDRTQAATTGFSAPLSSNDSAGRMTPSEQATLNDLRDKSRNSEVIVIVRSKDDPSTKADVMVLSQASPAFVQQLTAEHPAQNGMPGSAFDARTDRDPTIRR